MAERKVDDVSIDFIMLELVPKIVDENPKTLRDTRKYWEYAQAQADEFLGVLTILPATYTAGLSKKILKKEKSAVYACKDSPIDLRLNFKPGFNVYVTGKKKETLQTIPCPLYTLLFKHIEPEPTEEKPWAVQPTPMIIEAALKQFFLYQQDMDAGTLKVGGFNGEERVLEDLPLLERFLPKGTIIEARTDCAGTGEARYRI